MRSASAISETSAEFGGALGVAMLGSIATYWYRNAMAVTDAPSTARATLNDAVLAAGADSPAWLTTAKDAFANAYALNCVLSAVGMTLLALALWVALPDTAFAASGMMLAGVVQALRLMRWRGWRTVASPLLMMLHVAFAFIPCGLFAVGLGGFDVLLAATGLHLLGIGGVGGMTLAVMMRASLGHTGRALEVGPVLTTAFASVALAAVVRASAPAETGLWVAAALWTAGYAAFVVLYAAILTTENAGRKQANLKVG